MRSLAGCALVMTLMACEERHDVRVLFGPRPGTLTIGFQCVDDVTGEALFLRAASMGHFALVVDTLTISGGMPGCRGEELSEACVAGRCGLAPARYCLDIATSDVELDAADPRGSLQSIADYLRDTRPVISTDAPDEVTVIRAVISTEYCDTIRDPRVPLDLDEVVGCAYSCPVRLDDVDGSISLSLDALNDRCEAHVRACAKFPRE